jgi:hypothetical protein
MLDTVSRLLLPWAILASLAFGCTQSVAINIRAVDAAVDSEAAVVDAGPGPACGVIGGSCNIVSGTGCPQDQGCYRLAGSSTCAGVGTGGAGAPCSMPLDCSPGYTCNAAELRCSKRCCSDTECTGISTSMFCFDGTEGGICEAGDCDIYSDGANGCPVDLPVCWLGVSIDGTPRPKCLPHSLSAGGVGSQCTFVQPVQCLPGLTCSGSGSTGTCLRICDPTDPARVVCPTGRRCRASSIPGLSLAVGVCL